MLTDADTNPHYEWKENELQRNKGSTDVLTGHLSTSESKQHQKKSHPAFAILLFLILCARHTRKTDANYTFITFSNYLLIHLVIGRGKETTESEPSDSKQKPDRTLINVDLKVKLPESKTNAAK